MNVQEYISSGVVETYVLMRETLSSEELVEFEQACALYPEVLAAREAFEISLENQAMATAVPPAAELRTAVMDTISIPAWKDESGKSTNNDTAAPVQRMRISRPVWLNTAAVILLFATVGVSFYLFKENQGLKQQQISLLEENKDARERIRIAESSMAVMKDPAIKPVPMNGVAASPEAKATIYWNTKTKDVYLLVNNLPMPAADKQYQLWAIVGGKPVDAGVFEVNARGQLLTKMKNIPAAEAFAVTLEKKGGSPTPTLTAMLVLGET